MLDIKQTGDMVIAAVKGYVSRAIGSIETKLVDLEKRISEIPAGEKGDKGLDGNDGVQGKSAYEIFVDNWIAFNKHGLPPNESAWLESLQGKDGVDGKDGIDGKDADNELIIKQVTEFTEGLVEDIKPQNGVDGKEGEKGADGLSAYEIWCKHHPEFGMTEEAWAVHLKANDGENGTDGKDGINGKSAYELACENGFEGNIDEWIHSLKGLNGTNGNDGKDADEEKIYQSVTLSVTAHIDARIDSEVIVQSVEAAKKAAEDAVSAIPIPQDGVNGKDGTDGKDGESIHPDTVALMIVEQVRKEVSELPVPKDGANGKDGEDGRDALQLDPLPGIDPEKSYPRGTWASYNGGLIRASRKTLPIVDTKLTECGWVVMVEGVSAISISQSEDARTLSISTMLTSGIETQQQFKMPALLYRGIWREGTYEEGDIVTSGGSAWHCNTATTDRPGNSSAWRLMVKQGQPGKDGKKGDEPDQKSSSPVKLA